MDPPIPLEGLSSADLWSLLKRCALGGVTNADGTTSAQYSHLEAIGMSIVQRLRGSPLAARIIGSLLKKKLDVHHWKTVLESKLRYLDSDELPWGKGKDGILPAVLLSYQYLDGALKQCFAHCSLFPKGYCGNEIFVIFKIYLVIIYTFDREDVVQQWEAQCFIRTDRGTRMEMSGSRYFDELLYLSFFEFTTCYAMHDAVHDFAECVSSDACFRLEDERYEKIPLTVRHMSVCLSKCYPTRLLSLSRYEKLRTLLFLPGFEFDGFMSSHVLDEMFSKFKFLRVLGLRHCQIKELPESVGDLKQLRYLDLSGNELLRRLPESLGNLCHLQTLKLEGCGVLHALPARMSELTSLRRLQADDVLVSNIDGLGKLTNLEELRVRGRRVRALEGMSMLRKVSVWDLEEVESKEEAIQIRLHSMSCLQVLQLEWSTRRRRDRMPMTHEAVAVVVEEEEGVLQALRPNGDSIEELHIWGYRGAKSPDWMEAPAVASFSRLRHVVVGCCPSCPDLPSSLCQLPLLESIKISSMPRWEGWDADRFNALQDPSSALPFFPRLRELQIRKCPKLTELPLLPRTLKSLHLEEVGLVCLPGLRPLLQSSGSSSSSSASVALSRLHIRSCHNLTSVSGLLQLQLPSLKEVVIEMCRQLAGFPEKGFGHLPSLEKLWILRCPNLQRPALPPTKYLPLFLEELRVHWCGDAMGWWWLAGLRRLRYLSNLSLRGGPAMAGTFTTASS
ncbi:hypothetical protein Taro_005480 [Colocasia esculenta]|uniref:NB-ARC domain-containing protein n=1 Tax=Colocasia esculenta TaxID=4460 RepID=A0A843TPW6_COLES|nr:hypothetical protein [Colocasia esculenta]